MLTHIRVQNNLDMHKMFMTEKMVFMMCIFNYFLFGLHFDIYFCS